ncbi:OmpA family protein [candidate division KSB1 bacterium]|nr:OmpA family protein [candidate division KSB1 bacterium]
MKKHVVAATLLVSVLFATVLVFAAQQSIKDRLFAKTNELFAEAKSVQADLLSPKIYRKAVEKKEDAEKDFEKGKNVEKKLIEIEGLLQEAISNAKLAKLTFPHLLTAREDALEANAPQYALEMYERAEEQFQDAAETVEDGDVKEAREKALKAEKTFREAELQAIKSSIIGTVRESLDQADAQDVEEYAPLSIAKAHRLLNEAESILNSNKSAKSEAREKAEQAEYEVNHAFYLAEKIKDLREDEDNWEKLILAHEEQFAKIIEALNFQPTFDEGFEKPANSAVLAIDNLKNENKRLNQEVAEQNEQIEKLSSELNSVRTKLTGVQAEVDQTKKKEEKYERIQKLFTKNEADVIREGDKVTLRLVGLNFGSGKAIIEPEYFSLLSKVQRAIQIFPDYGIIVEGHTDAVGNDSYNQKLSTNRANAVREYLIASMGLNSGQITAVGYGENKPIASNDSEAGRRKNRRIDIVLSPKM